MANTFDVSFVNQYQTAVEILEQQKTARLMEAVRIETQNAEYGFYDQLNAVTTLTTNPSQHADTVIIDTPHVRRRVGLNYYTWAELIDEADDVKSIINATSSYAINAAYAMSRQKDIEIITAFDASAATGKTGSGSATFDNDMIITASGSMGGSTGGMNIDKLKYGKYLLDKQEVDDDDRYCVITAQQLKNLLDSTEVTNSDYNSVKTLVNGQVDTFLGFKFIKTELLDLTGDTRTCYMWHKSAMLLAVGIDQKGFKAKIDERPDKNYSTQIFNSMSIGATRMKENAVVKVECVEI